MWKIPMYKIYWDQSDIDSVSNAVKDGMFWATGPAIDQFESSVAEYIGTKYAVMFNSGTSALHAALLAHGIGVGDEVIVPSFTFIATANAPLFVGARPVFADIEERTFGLDPESVREKITPKTKAIIPIHYGGLPCQIKELRKIADENDLILIEDAAEAFGAKIGSQKVGTFGHSAMLSFCANKIITTGEGGAIVTDSKDIADKLKLIRSHGREDKQVSNYFSSEKPADYVDLGFNFRMSNITASLGVSQLKKVNKIISLRRKNAEYMTSILSEIPGIRVLGDANSFSVYQLFTIQLENEEIRNKVGLALNENGVMTKVYFPPVHLTSFYRSQGHTDGELPVTEKISKNVLTLPMYPSMTENEMNTVAEIVKREAM